MVPLPALPLQPATAPAAVPEVPPVPTAPVPKLYAAYLQEARSVVEPQGKKGECPCPKFTLLATRVTLPVPGITHCRARRAMQMNIPWFLPSTLRWQALSGVRRGAASSVVWSKRMRHHRSGEPIVSASARGKRRLRIKSSGSRTRPWRCVQHAFIVCLRRAHYSLRHNQHGFGRMCVLIHAGCGLHRDGLRRVHAPL